MFFFCIFGMIDTEVSRYVEGMGIRMKKREPKKVLIAILIGILIVFMIPIKRVRNDGGTKEYTSMFYKVIIWHMINEEYFEEDGSSDEEPFLTGTEVLLFPTHFFAHPERPGETK